MEIELEEEQNVAGQSFDANRTYGAYAIQLLERRDKLDRSLVEISEQVVQAREALNQAFAELKKFELASEAVTQRAHKLSNHREQLQQDELALTLYRRKGD